MTDIDEDTRIKTYVHDITGMGIGDDDSLIITFANEPFGGILVISPKQFEQAYQMWCSLRKADIDGNEPQ